MHKVIIYSIAVIGKYYTKRKKTFIRLPIKILFIQNSRTSKTIETQSMLGMIVAKDEEDR